MLIATGSQAQVSREVPPTTSPADRIVKLYPNPAITYVTFDLQSGYQKGLSLQVFSFLGKKMYESQNVPQKLTIELTEYNRGLYMYHLTDPSGRVIESGKFQVTK